MDKIAQGRTLWTLVSSFHCKFSKFRSNQEIVPESNKQDTAQREVIIAYHYMWKSAIKLPMDSSHAENSRVMSHIVFSFMSNSCRA